MKNRRTLTLICPFVLVSLAFFLEALLRSSLNSIFHLLKVNFSVEQIGILASGFFFAYAVMQLFVGYLLDRYAVKKILLIALGVVLVATLFMTSTSYYFMLTGRILTGLGAAGIFLSGSYFIQNTFPRKNAAFFTGLYISIGFFGGFAANLPFLLLVDTIGLPGAWMACSLLSASLLLGILWLWPTQQSLEHQQEASSCHVDTPTGKLSSDIIAIVFIGFSAALIDIVTGVFGSLWGGEFLQTAKHLTPNTAAFISSLTFIGYMCGAPLFGYLYARTKHMFYHIILVSLLVAAGFYDLIYLTNNVYGVSIIVFILGMLAGQNIFAFRIPFLMTKRYRGVYLAIANFIIMGGTAVCDIIIPKIYEISGSIHESTSFFIVAALFSSLFAMCAMRFTKIKHLG